jgi:hypothetical protein
VSNEQDKAAITRSKCPGVIDITNTILRECRKIVTPTIGTLFWVSFRFEFMPSAWKDTKKVVSKKPGKSDYTVPKAYWSVEIASCIRRLFGSVIQES